MDYKKTDIEGVWVLEPKVFNDNRGYFFESFRQSDFDEHIGRHVEFIQDNESKSSYGVLRGLHYQKGEFSQAKLVRVISGKVVEERDLLVLVASFTDSGLHEFYLGGILRFDPTERSRARCLLL